MKTLSRVILGIMVLIAPATAHATLFDFDSTPAHVSLPLDLTVDGITAHFSATGQGFSIQPANTMGFTPAGFAGNCIYPNSIYLADLLVGFSQTLTDFSIMYSPQELGCDDSATMRVTAYMDNVYVGTNTTTAYPPGTWPTGTLTFSAAQGFNRVVVHYDAPPPTCQDYGVIYMADNMIVTAAPASVDGAADLGALSAIASPNPFERTTSIRLSLPQTGPVAVTIYDPRGSLVRTLSPGTTLDAGIRTIPWDGLDDRGRGVPSGAYFCRVRTGTETVSTRLLLLKAR